ncbi:ABC transporter ATP-binding protein [Microbacterium sp.]|uniref:ABC transporter ATP-binding protein n=1 Tax=Microbacterium sp. TaxID=51671 RepID=UPI0039E33B45
MTSSTPAISLEDVTVRYGSQTAVANVSLAVEQGEFVTLLGPSGSGKTTLLNLVAGAFAPYKGTVRINGKDVSHAPTHTRNIGMVFQSYTLFPSKTVAKNVAFPLEIRREPKEKKERRVLDALRTVRLLDHADKLPAQISGGQAQRVALARAIVFDPDILLFDEPLGALDRALRKDLQREIRRIQQSIDVPALYVTHDQEEAMTMSDRIVLFRDGGIVQQGTPREVYEQPASVWAATFLGAANVWPITRANPASGGEVTIETDGFTVTLPASAGDPVVGATSVVSRPEDCVLTSAEVDGVRCHPGSVTAIEYLGTGQNVTVRLVGGPQLVALTSGRGQRYEVGEPVFCHWRPGAHSIVPAD